MKPKRLAGLYIRGKTWWFTWRENGVKRFVSLETSDYGQAVTRALKIAGTPGTRRPDRLSDERERFLAAKKAGGHYSRHTGEWAETPLKRLESFLGNVTPGKVTKDHIEAFWSDMLKELADTSAASYMRAVSSFFSWLVERHVIHASPCTGLKLPKVAEAARIRYCSADLRDALIASADDWDLRFILFAGFHAGLRRMEIIEARPEWFNLERGFVTIGRTSTFVPKDRERREVPLTRAFLAFLATYPLPFPFVLKPSVRHWRALYRYDFRLPFRRHMERHGCPWVTPHVMRHTFATQYISAGGSLFRLARYLGDTPETTEKHYAHLIPDREDIERGHINPATPPL